MQFETGQKTLLQEFRYKKYFLFLFNYYCLRVFILIQERVRSGQRGVAGILVYNVCLIIVSYCFTIFIGKLRLGSHLQRC